MTITAVNKSQIASIRGSPTRNKKQIYESLSEILVSVDYNSFRVSKLKYKLISELTHDLIFSNAFNKILKLRAIFSWLSFVDPSSLNFSTDDPSAISLNLLKKGGSYAQAFEVLAKHMGIDVKCINGWGKGENYRVGEDLLSKTPNHTWNAVEVDGEWFLIDCYWSRTKDLADLDDFFFLTDPHQFIHSHFPQEPQWQLLGSAVHTAEKFISLPYLKPEFFKLSLQLSDNYQRFLSSSNSIVVELQHNGRVGFSFKLLNERGEDCRKWVFQEIQDEHVRYYVRPQTFGMYYLQVFATSVFSGYHDKVVIHKSVASFKLEFKGVFKHPDSFPHCSDACWGIPQIYRHLVSPRFPSAYVVNPSKKLNFSIHKTSQDEEVYVRLVHLHFNHQSLLPFITINQSKLKADITIEQPDDNELGIEVYIKKAETEGKFLFFCQLLVTSLDHLGLSDVESTEHAAKEVKHLKEFQCISDPIEKLKAIYKGVCSITTEDQTTNNNGQVTSRNKHCWLNDIPELSKFKQKLLTYAELFQALCSHLGFECEIVEGLVKDVEGNRLMIKQHTWNVVWLSGKNNDKGVLVDCCWGARRVIDDFTRASLISIEDDYYFNPPPQQLIYSHFPTNPTHQLISPVITQPSFEKSAPLKPPFFQMHLKLPQNTNPPYEIITEDGDIGLSVQLPSKHSASLLFSNSLMRYSKHKTSNETSINANGGSTNGALVSCVENGSEVLEGHVLQYEEKGCMHFRMRLPSSGEYRLVLFVKHSGDVFMEMLEHLLVYKGFIKHQPFPLASLPTWGNSELSKVNKMFYKGGHMVFCGSDGKVDLNFGVGKLMKFGGVLRGLKGEVKCGVLLRKVEEKLLVSLQCFEEGEYCLELYANDGNDEIGLMASKLPMYLAYQLLVVCPSIKSSPNTIHQFPFIASDFLGPQSANNFFNVCLSGNDDHFFRLPDNNVQLTFTNQQDVRLCGKLYRVSHEGHYEDCSSYILQQNRESVTTFETTLPYTSMFIFQLFGSESSSHNLLNIFNVLLHCTHISIPSCAYPVQFDHWDGVLHHPLHTNIQHHTSFKIQLNKAASLVLLKVDENIEEFVKEPQSQIWTLKTDLGKYTTPVNTVEVCASFIEGTDDEDNFATLLEYNVRR